MCFFFFIGILVSHVYKVDRHTKIHTYAHLASHWLIFLLIFFLTLSVLSHISHSSPPLLPHIPSPTCLPYPPVYKSVGRQADYSILPLAQAARLTPSSTAARPQSSPWLWEPAPTPARARAWSSLRTVRTPKMTGMPRSRPTRIRPCDTASEMYSKCIVSPLISTPIAMMASKG